MRSAEISDAHARQWLDQPDIRYVLINTGALEYHVNVDRTHTPADLRRFTSQQRQLEASLLDRVYDGSKMIIYKIRD